MYVRESFSKGSLSCFSCFPICAQASSSSVQVAYRRGQVQRLQRHVLVRHHLDGEQRLVRAQLRSEADFWRGRAQRPAATTLAVFSNSQLVMRGLILVVQPRTGLLENRNML